MVNKEYILDVISKIKNGTASESELQSILDLLGSSENQFIIDIISDSFSVNRPSIATEMSSQKEILSKILTADKLDEDTDSLPRSSIIKMFWKVAVAAVILIAVAAVAFWGIRESKNNLAVTQPKNEKQTDRLPGVNRATLTLADGRVIILDSTSKGVLTIQGKTTVIKMANGQLAYKNDQLNGGEVLYNKIDVPRGGQYELLLADGTKVWLNSESSLRFPASFVGSERNVELEGEGYFEVAKNKAKPFHVLSNNITISVLGTHFNVMAYKEEDLVKTTLMEGSIKVLTSADSTFVTPGQQAVFTKRNNRLAVNNDADIDEAIAWKNGFFQFNKIDASAIRQLSRWYDIDIVFAGALPDNEFKGKIAKNIKLSSVIEALKISGIYCRIENNKLIVGQ